ncbi:Hypothetical protein, putative [Bodo saltans]|uniref:Uncharacterized protein n=1 Tax=Bodo saltans TaxID=75058 RepID=A0A0S4J9P7_BODSA|nr:Hypothetical protein, putative [Bodo saltans]|eukprot:CUG85780.1 Hypothetical protein, putative [Bodo saltans]
MTTSCAVFNLDTISGALLRGVVMVSNVSLRFKQAYFASSSTSMVRISQVSVQQSSITLSFCAISGVTDRTWPAFLVAADSAHLSEAILTVINPLVESVTVASLQGAIHFVNTTVLMSNVTVVDASLNVAQLPLTMVQLASVTMSGSTISVQDVSIASVGRVILVDLLSTLILNSSVSIVNSGVNSSEALFLRLMYVESQNHHTGLEAVQFLCSNSHISASSALVFFAINVSLTSTDIIVSNSTISTTALHIAVFFSNLIWDAVRLIVVDSYLAGSNPVYYSDITGVNSNITVLTSTLYSVCGDPTYALGLNSVSLRDTHVQLSDTSIIASNCVAAGAQYGVVISNSTLHSVRLVVHLSRIVSCAPLLLLSSTFISTALDLSVEDNVTMPSAATTAFVRIVLSVISTQSSLVVKMPQEVVFLGTRSDLAALAVYVATITDGSTLSFVGRSSSIVWPNTTLIVFWTLVSMNSSISLIDVAVTETNILQGSVYVERSDIFDSELVLSNVSRLQLDATGSATTVDANITVTVYWSRFASTQVNQFLVITLPDDHGRTHTNVRLISSSVFAQWPNFPATRLVVLTCADPHHNTAQPSLSLSIYTEQLFAYGMTSLIDNECPTINFLSLTFDREVSHHVVQLVGPPLLHIAVESAASRTPQNCIKRITKRDWRLNHRCCVSVQLFVRSRCNTAMQSSMGQ